MNPVTDPELLRALEAPDAAQPVGLKPVSDPGLLEQLNMTDEQTALRQKARKEIEAVGGPGLPSLANRLPIIGPLLDEISAGIQGGVKAVTGFGRSYDEALAFNREREKMAAEAHPVYDVVGGTTAAIALGGGPLSKAFTATSVPGMVAQGGLYGGIIGGIDAFGNAEGGFDRRADAAGSGAASGAVIGALAPPVIQGLSAVGGRVADAVSPTLARWGATIPERIGMPKMSAGEMPTSPGADAAAEKVIANQLVRAGVTPQQLRERMTQADEAARLASNSRAQNAVAPVDLDTSLQRLAGSVARQQPEAANIGQSFIVSRQTGQPTQGLRSSSGLTTREAFSKAGETPAGQYERVTDALKRALLISDDQAHQFKGSAYRTDQAIMKRAQSEAQTTYVPAFKAAEGFDLRPTVNPVFAQWRSSLIDEPAIAASRIERAIKQFERAVGDGGVKSRLERLDKAKQVLDEEISKLFNSSAGTNRYVGRKLNDFKNDVLRAVDAIEARGIGKKYAEARANYSSHMEMRDALQMGRDAWKADSEITLDQFNTLSKGQQKLFRLGLWDGFRKEGAQAKRTADIVQKFENPRVQELLAGVIPKSQGKSDVFADRAERFGRWLANEKRMIQTRNEVLGNSKTAERQADDRALNAMMSLVEEVKGQPTLFAMGVKAVETALNKLFGFRADTAAAVAQRLFTTSPLHRERLLQSIERRMTPTRAAMLGRYLQEYRNLVTQSAVAGSAVTE